MRMVLCSGCLSCLTHVEIKLMTIRNLLAAASIQPAWRP
jgi:hypothetical protein